MKTKIYTCPLHIVRVACRWCSGSARFSNAIRHNEFRKAIFSEDERGFI